MKHPIGLVVGSTALLLAGCSVTNPPLMFGDIVTYGLRLGNDESTGGGSVALGVKMQSVAIVPVTYLNENDEIKYLNGRSANRLERDGMSVFASFESHAPQDKMDSAGNAIVDLGQVFSTGLAAQAITRGYVCRQTTDNCVQLEQQQEAANKKREERDKEVAKAREERRKEAAQARLDREARLLPIRLEEETRRMQLGLVDKGQADAKKEKPGADSDNARIDVEKAPYQKPLLFARTDVIGIDIGGSLAQQGLQFVLGYTGRNLALIPTTTRSDKGKVASIMGIDEDGDGPPAMDAFSVLGQFKANTEIRRLGFGLERYFATGFAARNLGDGVGMAIANDPPKKNPSPPGATTGTKSATSPAPAAPTTPTAVADSTKP